MHCSGHQLDYEKKSVKITWLRCKICGNVLGWLEDDRQLIEGKVTETVILREADTKIVVNSISFSSNTTCSDHQGLMIF